MIILDSLKGIIDNLENDSEYFSGYNEALRDLRKNVDDLIAENSKNRFFLKVYKYYIQYRNLKRLNKDENNISQSLEYYEDCMQKMTNDFTREYYSHGLISFKNKIKSRSLLKGKVKLILDYTEKDRTLFMKYWDSLEAACTLQDKINGLLSRLTNATITLTTHQRNRFRRITGSAHY